MGSAWRSRRGLIVWLFAIAAMLCCVIVCLTIERPRYGLAVIMGTGLVTVAFKIKPKDLEGK